MGAEGEGEKTRLWWVFTLLCSGVSKTIGNINKLLKYFHLKSKNNNLIEILILSIVIK